MSAVDGFGRHSRHTAYAHTQANDAYVYREIAGACALMSCSIYVMNSIYFSVEPSQKQRNKTKSWEFIYTEYSVAFALDAQTQHTGEYYMRATHNIDRRSRVAYIVYKDAMRTKTI